MSILEAIILIMISFKKKITTNILACILNYLKFSRIPEIIFNFKVMSACYFRNIVISENPTRIS